MRNMEIFCSSAPQLHIHADAGDGHGERLVGLED